jgi:hypothetical protein
MTSRRQFMFKTLPAVSLAMMGAPAAQAQAAKVDEKDPAAAAIGYKHDASKVDKQKYPKWAATQHCANCQLYQGKASDAWAPCAVVGGKQVNGKGWCTAWVKKA